MPRAARKESKTGIYHIILRGINQQQIFEDEEDNTKFLQIVKDYKATSGFKLYAYCLMGNHVHLLIKVETEGLEQIFKRIGAKYVYWFNGKYNRTGHLFQDRFKSEPVESDEYFLTVLRYIHQNPVKAGLTNTVDAYKWSSYNEYVGKSSMVNTRFALKSMTKEEFARFNNEENNDTCIENTSNRINDNDAKLMITELSGCSTVGEFQALDTEEKHQHIKRFKEAGLSIRQISRLTGVSKGVIERMLG